MADETDLKRRWRWEKELLAADIKLPDGYQKLVLVAYCFAMATKGSNGLHLFASDDLIARQLQMGSRKTIWKYRHLAIELGWLTLTGVKRGRASEVNISFPDDAVRSVGEVFHIEPEPVAYEPPVKVAPIERTEDPWADDPWAS